MRDVLEIVVRLGDTMLEHRFEPLGTIDGLAPTTEWTRVQRGLVEVSARRTAAPTKHALASSLGDRRVLGYVAVSLAAHLVLWGVATEEPPEITLRIDPPKQVAARIADVRPAAGVETTAELGDSDDTLVGGGAPSMRLASLASGQGATDRDAGLSTRPAVITKAEAIERARAAGLLGSAVLDQLGTAASVGSFDADAIYGPLLGSSGEGNASFGFGRAGLAMHGTCGGVGCQGTSGGIVGTGRYGTISNGRGAGEQPRGRSPGRASRGPMVILCAGPKPCMVAVGGLDKALIRRYVQRQLPKIQYCYEKELLANDTLHGIVDLHFLIQPDGHVSTVQATGVSPAVASCVGGVIKSIEFPAQRAGIPDQRSVTDVRYPFTFRTAGS